MSATMERMRHPDNSNLVLYRNSIFRSMRVYEGGPLIENYLDRIDKIIQTALLHHTRVAALRFDLRLPHGRQVAADHNRLMTAFWERLKDRIESNRAQAKRTLDMAHDTSVHYVWAREYDETGNRPHWHCVLLVNKDAYRDIGRLKAEGENMYTRIVAAWNSALGLPPGQDFGLVHVPNNPVYHLHRESDGSDFRDLFYRLSYFAKERSKQYGGSVNAFGGSRIAPSLVGT